MNNKIYGIIFILSFTVLSCDNPKTAAKQPVKDTTPVRVSGLPEAKKLAAQIFGYVEQADKKEISKKKLASLADPLQAKLDSIRNTLNSQEIMDLDQYRSSLVSAMVDRKVERDRK